MNSEWLREKRSIDGCVDDVVEKLECGVPPPSSGCSIMTVKCGIYFGIRGCFSLGDGWSSLFSNGTR